MTISLETEPSGGQTVAEGLRFVAVRANLLPAEVLAARAADVTRRRVLIALGALVAVLALAFGASWWQTHASHNDLAVERQRDASLQAATNQFAPLVTAQQATNSVHEQLQRLMVGDVSWQRMLVALQAQGSGRVTITQVTGTISTGLAAASGNATPPTPAAAGVTAAGSMTVVGTAADKTTVANYTDALQRIKGLGTPSINSVTAAERGVVFTLTVPITSAATGGRWTAAAGSSTGGH